MKRFYVTAAIAASLLATSCQKTYVIDEVRTPIGFSTEVGKQTKTIIDGTTFTGEFGVISYGIQGATDLGHWSNTLTAEQISGMTRVMDNVKISKRTADNKWAAAQGAYYWPNDDKTSLSFFAYYPYQEEPETSTDPDQKTLGQKPGVDANGITLTNYVHDNIYVDFMTADAKDRTFKEPDGVGVTPETEGTVKLQFKHQLTQLVFAVKKADNYAGINMTLQSITLNNIINKANFKNEAWELLDTKDSYTIEFASGELTTTAVSSKGMTVIPQTLTAAAQTMTIVYKISGTGVAEETVTKTVDLKAGNVISWDKKQKITYNITIAMNEILFSPSVENWSPVSSSDIQINQ